MLVVARRAWMRLAMAGMAAVLAGCRSVPHVGENRSLPDRGEEQGFVYRIADGTVAITEYTGSEADVAVPAAINGLPVTSIQNEAFHSHLRWFQDPVRTNIAFHVRIGCHSLTRVTIPDSVGEIGALAFFDCINLTNVTLGCGVTNIGWGAFFSCTNLAGIYCKGQAPRLAEGGCFGRISRVTIYHLPGAAGWTNAFGGQPTAVWNPQAPAASAGTSLVRYTVRRGDTLSGIAHRSGGDTVADLAQRNALLNPDRIAVGEVLYVRGGMPPAPDDERAEGRGSRHRTGAEFPLTVATNGVEGKIVLLLDEKLPEECDPLSARQYAPAIVKITTAGGRTLEQIRLKMPAARLTAAADLPGSPPWLALTEDFSCGFGSYAGPVTSFLRVVAGKVQWLQATDAASGAIGRIELLQSLKTDWKVVPASPAKDVEIRIARCRPDFKEVNGKRGGTFEITYGRYLLRNGKWIYHERTEPGSWESENDSSFPDESKYRF
jgi:hypothetical protein